ncbi:hypothetical protein Q75_09225 [Bacillus coahuilensis p1.1.43]|uniref:Homoserine kinase n=1 Tax=Bacillus coahuilensis p1.1.43 TaxID=1150625 RepID=A0A147K879_9BACI|nr:homoserine kinase [Bacillus coahuilensis]KUP06310.1 hypothetical protein Q75_09225 [Bacillus coahuilensis p1.1.43]
MIIQVPGSTANLGPGFDSIGLAIDKYLTLQVQDSSVWMVEPKSSSLVGFPQDENHFIVSIAIETAKRFNVELTPKRIEIETSIPLGKGFGSSASAIVAGVELADYACDLKLTKQEKLVLASFYEGHPDNVGASIYGGLVVSCQLEDDVYVVSCPSPNCTLVMVSPKTPLDTAQSRSALPRSITYSQATKGSAISNVLVAALLQEEWGKVGEMMKEERFHHPYRKQFVPYFEEVEDIALCHGAFGVALSGAGPSMACFVEWDKAEMLEVALRSTCNNLDVETVKIDGSGVQCKMMIGEQ